MWSPWDFNLLYNLLGDIISLSQKFCFRFTAAWPPQLVPCLFLLRWRWPEVVNGPLDFPGPELLEWSASSSSTSAWVAHTCAKKNTHTTFGFDDTDLGIGGLIPLTILTTCHSSSFEQFASQPTSLYLLMYAMGWNSTWRVTAHSFPESSQGKVLRRVAPIFWWVLGQVSCLNLASKRHAL